MEFDEGGWIVVEEQLRRARRQAEELKQQLADGQVEFAYFVVLNLSM